LQAAFPTVTIGGTSYATSITWTDLIEITENDDRLKAPLIWIVDVSETLGKHTTDVPWDERELLIITQMKIPSADLSAETAQVLSSLSSQIARYVLPTLDDEPLYVNDMVCITAKRTAKNLQDYAQMKYYSEILLTFRG
jgi:hypothetical protein